MHRKIEFEIDWKKFLEGDRDSFQNIYNANFKSLYLYALRFCRDEETIKDVIHNVFINFWEKRASVKSVKSLPFYLLRSTRNEILNLKRQEGKYHHSNLEEDSYSFSFELPREANIIEKEQLIENRHRLKLAFEHLTDRQKEILYLKYVKGMSFEQIAQTTGITLKAAYKLHARAIQSIRNNFGDIGYSIAFMISLYFIEG